MNVVEVVGGERDENSEKSEGIFHQNIAMEEKKINDSEPQGTNSRRINQSKRNRNSNSRHLRIKRRKGRVTEKLV